MRALAVHLWGTRIGAAALDDSGVVAFEYAPDFLPSGVEVAPLTMPLRPGVHRFPALSRDTFLGLPGLLSDSLPDRYGHALIDAWLARKGRTPDSLNVLERLAWVGTRGMGALTFHPPADRAVSADEALDIQAMVELASAILSEREQLVAHLGDDPDHEALQQLVQVGTSAGGARAKALIAWNPESGEVRAGQLDVPAGIQHWLLKFDGVDGNRDRELADPLGYGVLEYVYHLMARDAGIDMSECRLLDEGPRRHFLTRRFDRTPDGSRLHMLTLGGLAHLDFNAPGAHAWEDAYLVARQLGLGQPALDQLFLRMTFNVFARNQDDHVKNISFLMDRRGRWTLAPAYDLTWSFNPSGSWTSRHQMSIAGKRDHFVREDLIRAAGAADIAPGRAEQLIARVSDAVASFSELAQAHCVDKDLVAAVTPTLRLHL